MKKECYIQAMVKVLSAYTDDHIASYFEEVKVKGITEHGFPRLAANLGILLCRGYRENLLPLFIEMMDFCTQQMPLPRTEETSWAGNDFAVKEMIFCLMEVEKCALVSFEKTAQWRANLAAIIPENTYSVFAKAPSDKVNNWAIFTAVSEWMRMHIGVSQTQDFVDLQLSAQTRYIDPNGMYRDPNEPMVYDLVSRGLFCVLLHFGYKGVYRELLDAALKRAGLLSLKMQSVSGEIAYGGRSAQCVYNEAHLALIFEFEANRYHREGNEALASHFKARAALAFKNIEYWLSRRTVHHIKNCYPTEMGFGCEGYSYFNKYMITVASFLYVAYLFSDDAIESVEVPREADVTFTAEPFHKCFLEAGDYFLEFELAADTHYDENGLGRVHKKGAPSPLCLSVPMTEHPNYRVEIARAAAMVPGYEKGGMPCLAFSGAASYRPFKTEKRDGFASVSLLSEFEDRTVLKHMYEVSEAGVDIAVCGAQRVLFSFLVFDFDGETKTEVQMEKSRVSVSYEGYRCIYETNGEILFKGEYADNRNGRYRVMYAAADNALSMHITIEKV